MIRKQAEADDQGPARPPAVRTCHLIPQVLSGKPAELPMSQRERQPNLRLIKISQARFIKCITGEFEWSGRTVVQEREMVLAIGC